MKSQTYNQLRQQLATEQLFQPNNLYGSLTVVLNLAFFVAGAVGLAHVSRFSWVYWLLEMLLGLSTFRFFVILHDCGHRNLFKQRWLNNWVGTLVSPLSFYPFEIWRQLHNAHHQWAGIVGKDPDVPDIEAIQQSPGIYSLLTFCWRYWLPLPLAYQIVSVYWLYPLSGLKQGKVLGRSWLSLIAMLLPHAIWLLLAPLTYLIYVGPVILAGLLWMDLITVPLHSELAIAPRQMPLPYRQHGQVTRDLRIWSAIAVILTHNFNLHVEHHWFPGIPWYRLPRISQGLPALDAVPYNQAHPFAYLASIRRSQPATVFQPRKSV